MSHNISDGESIIKVWIRYPYLERTPSAIPAQFVQSLVERAAIKMQDTGHTHSRNLVLRQFSLDGECTPFSVNALSNDVR